LNDSGHYGRFNNNHYLMPTSKQSLFVPKTKAVKSARDLHRLAHNTAVDVDVDQYTSWAKGVLRAARLPTNLWTKTEAGRNFIVLFDKVQPGTVEERAAKVLSYAQALRHHLKNGNGDDAVWCALRMSQHMWMGFIDQTLTDDFKRGGRQLESLAEGRRVRQAKSQTAKTAALADQLKRENQEKSWEWVYREVASRLGIDQAAAKKRVLRQRRK
jgi:hypothetical protein